MFKHVVLTRILAYLAQKPSPVRVIDSHAGDGLYDLAGPEAERTGEWRQGVGRLTQAGVPAELAPLFGPYLAIVTPFLAEASPRYPGSPALTAALLRRQDRMIFCETHPDAYAALKARMAGDRRARIVAIDGFTELGAYLPPVERRGLALIDPPFEARNEFDRIAAALAAALRKWPTGCYMIWFPIKDRNGVARFYGEVHAAISRANVRDAIRLELWIDPARPDGPLTACGLVIVNPPYVLEAEAHLILPYLARIFEIGGQAGHEIAPV